MTTGTQETTPVALTRSQLTRRMLQRLSDSPEIGIILALIVTFVAFTIKNPLFASVSDLQNPLGIDLAGFGILAIGESLAIITGGIDLSVGSLVAFFVVFSAWLNASEGIPVVFAFILTIMLGVGWGLWHGFLITKLGVAPFVATLVTFIFAVGADESIAPNPISIGSHTFLNVTGTNVAGVPIPVIVFLVIAVAAWVFLERTYIGRQMYAVGGNREAARLAGIRINRRIVLAYAISGGCAAIVGIIEASRLTAGTADSVSGWELIAIASAVIGGVSLIGGQGRIIGIVSGAALLVVLQDGLVAINVNAYYQRMVVGAALLIAILVDRLRVRRLERTARAVARPDRLGAPPPPVPGAAPPEAEPAGTSS